MNIAFSTLFLIILVLPGYFLRHFYLTSGNWALNGTDSIRASSGGSSNPLAYEVLIISFISIIIHSLTTLYSPIMDIYLNVLYFLPNHPTTLENINLQLFLWFFISLCIISSSLGWLSYTVIRYFKWDLKYKFLRFRFYWFYILSGECLGFPENGEEEIPEGAYVAATIEQNGKSYLYYGVLEDYVVGKSGKLEILFMRKSTRRELNNDTLVDPITSERIEDKNRFYRIKGDALVLKYKDIKSLNIEYFYIDRKK